MTTILLDPSFINIPKSLHFESSRLNNLKDFTKGCFSWLGFANIGLFLRNKFYLPIMDLAQRVDLYDVGSENDPEFFEKTTLIYMKTFSEMLKKQKEGIDPTFSHFEKIKELFEITDIPLKLKSEQRLFQLNLRIVQSHCFGQGHGGLRLILFSFNQNKEFVGDKMVPWNPKSLEEMATLPIELMRALKEVCKLDTLICFSLGALTLDSLKDLKEDVLPSTIILNRGLTSIKKVAPKILRYPFDRLAHLICSWYHLDADPENGFLHYLENNPSIAAQKTVVIIRALKDHYFSGHSDYSPDFFKRIKSVTKQFFEGSFMVPYLNPASHHSLRPDWMIAHPDSGSKTEAFLPIAHTDTLADALANFLSQDKKDHTCLVIGGSKDTLDTLLYSNATILNSWVKN